MSKICDKKLVNSTQSSLDGWGEGRTEGRSDGRLEGLREDEEEMPIHIRCRPIFSFSKNCYFLPECQQIKTKSRGYEPDQLLVPGRDRRAFEETFAFQSPDYILMVWIHGRLLITWYHSRISCTMC